MSFIDKMTDLFCGIPQDATEATAKDEFSKDDPATEGESSETSRDVETAEDP